MEDKPKIINIILVTGLVLVALVLALNQTGTKIAPITGNETPQINTITVSETGTVTVTPDTADIYLRVQTDAKTAEEAQQQNADIMADVRAALTKAGVADKDIETSSFYLSPQYDWQTGTSKLTGYTATHTMRIRTTNVKDAGTLADAGVKAGANGIDYISFTLSDDMEKQVKNQAITKASDAAKAKAQTLANAAGVTLGKIVGVSESSNYYPPIYYGRAEMAVGKDTAAGAPTEISPQSVDVTAYITLTYEIQ